MKPGVFVIYFILLFARCGQEKPSITIRDLPALSTASKETPNWVLSPQTKLYLSWTEHEADTQSSLKFAIWNDSTWSDQHTVATGRNWFVNWADFPSLAVFPGTDLNMMAHFLDKRSGGNTYDYDIKLAVSNNNGQSFRMANNLHDTMPAEHGFVTLLPFSFDKVLVTWLDGGQMAKTEHPTSHDHHGMGSMQLRSALVDISGQVSRNTLLDDRVCECCQTDAAMTGVGPVIVYRNRDDDEIRDIYYTRYVSGQWSPPKPIYNDHWNIGGCPVNGPAIASYQNRVAVAWYTEAGGEPSIKLAISQNAGETFEPPFLISKNTLGRIDLVWMNETTLAVSYLEKDTNPETEKAYIKLSLVSTDGNIMLSESIAETSAKRKSGFPVLEKLNQRLYLAYTRLLEKDRTDIEIREIKIW